MRLTKRYIDGTIYRRGASGAKNNRDIRWDDDLPGFGLRIYPSGRKAFVLKYRFKNRQKLHTLGTYGILTLDQARKLARTYLVDVLQGS